MLTRVDDTIRGSDDDDEFSGGTGPDRLYGLGGDDQIFAGAGDDRVFGGDGDDYLYSDPDDPGFPRDADTVFGDAGNDDIEGGYGSDSLSGGDGDDSVRIGDYLAVDRGIDTLDGGAGIDLLALYYYSLAVDVVFGADPVVRVEGEQYLIARNFEALDFYATGDVSVRVTGSDLTDLIRTSGGADFVAGGAGDDWISVSDGVDTVDAGVGDDFLMMVSDGRDAVTLGEGDDRLLVKAWDGADSGVAPTPGGRYDGGVGADTLAIDLIDIELSRVVFDGRTLSADGVSLGRFVGFENLVLDATFTSLRVEGLAGDDFVRGTERDDVVRGHDGDDAIGYARPGVAGDANQGRDTLEGGAGDDSIAAAVDDRPDVIEGGAGDDLLDLYIGEDSVVMTGDLGTGATISLDGKAVGAISGIERVRMEALEFSGTLLGASGDDTIEAYTGAYGIKTRTGDDYVRLTLDGFRDRIDLGRGVDECAFFDYEDRSVSMTGEIDDFTITRDGRVLSAVKGADRLLVGTGDGDDSLFGGALDDRFSVLRGDDTVRAGGGDDRITLTLGDGLDVIDGGDGADLLVADGAGFGARFTIAQSDAGFEIRAGKTTLLAATSVESLSFRAGSGDDRLAGRGGDDSFAGGSGDDELFGRNGDDTLSGGSGVDTLFGGDGDDRLECSAAFSEPVGFSSLSGGDGVDTVAFDLFVSGVSLKLGEAAVFRFDGVRAGSVSGVENIIGGRGDDVLTGDARDNVISGGSGSDTLDGARGSDTLDYGAYPLDPDAEEPGLVLALDGEKAVLAVDSEISPDLVRNFENVIGTRLDDDISGDFKNNAIEGAGGADTLAGGAGRDRFVYRETAVSADDFIIDFSRADKDRLDFSAIDADASAEGRQGLVFIGASTFSGERGEVRFSADAGSTLVAADIDGDGAADFAIELRNASSVLASDFLL